MDSITTIYCDESGFSGPNLMDDNSPVFIFASIAIANEDAAAIISKVKADHRLQMNELKFSSLIKSTNGRRAIADIISAIDDRMLITANNKKFALACKFYEYIFEPALREDYQFFYKVEFHKFIANSLYISFIGQSLTAERLMTGFHTIMREREVAKITELFTHLEEGSKVSALVSPIFEFAKLNQSAIVDEISSLTDMGGLETWVLDVSTASLFAHLVQWGEKYPTIEVYCDESKPIKAYSTWIDDMIIGHSDISEELELGADKPFRLAKPIQHVGSKAFPATQLADVVAGAFGFKFKYPEDELADTWHKALMPHVGNSNVRPELERLDLKDANVVLNAILLHNLVERSQNGVDLVDGIRDYMFAMAMDIVKNGNPIKGK